MVRRSAVMKLNFGMAEEYKRRHDEIWPQIIESIRRDGGKNYTIFHDPKTDYLFEYIEIEDEALWLSRGADEIIQKWWNYMSDIMETNPDKSPKCRKINEVFHMD